MNTEMNPDLIIERIFRASESAVLFVLQKMEADIVRYFERNKINVTGWLRNSITSEVQREAGRVVGIIGTNNQYAVYVHEGTRPHWPPVNPIKNWVIRKLGITGKDVESVTWAVRKKIATKGTEGKPYFRFILNQYQNKIEQMVIERMNKQLNVEVTS